MIAFFGFATACSGGSGDLSLVSQMVCSWDIPWIISWDICSHGSCVARTKPDGVCGLFYGLTGAADQATQAGFDALPPVLRGRRRSATPADSCEGPPRGP